MRKGWTILLVISLAFNVGIVSIIGYRMAERKKWMREGGPPRDVRENFMQKNLGLSKEQAGEIDDIFKETQKEILPFIKELDKNRKEIFALVKEEKIDESKKERLLAEMSRLQMEIEKRMLNNIIETRSKMTAAQRGKLEKMFNGQPRGFAEEGPPDLEGGRPGESPAGRRRPPSGEPRPPR